MLKIYIILAVIIFLTIAIISIFNNLIRARNKVKQSKSAIDVYLTQRFDLIPNLVETVKAYAIHETQTFTKMTEMRSQYANTKSIKLGETLTNEMNTIMAVAENYPELKASEQFLSLEKTLIRIESQLQAARRIYNGDVTLYNTAIQTFPNSIIASILHFRPEELFTAEEYKKQNIKVEI